MTSNTSRALLALLGLTFAGDTRAEGNGPAWQVFDRPMGNDLVPVCLVRHDGHWAEGDSAHPDACQEMLMAAVDAHALWADQSFYLARQMVVGYGQTEYRSSLFKFKLSTDNDPELQSAVLHAFSDSGAEKRLDGRFAKTKGSCSERYAKTTTIEQVQDTDKTCRSYAGAEAHEAYNRALARQDDAQESKEEALAAKSRPKCSTVSISGMTVGSEAQALDNLRLSPDMAEIIARHPLRCGPSGFTQTFACSGATVLSKQVGYIIAWSESDYQVATALDLTIGRKDALLYVNRADATCLDAASPSLDFTANLANFLGHHNANR